MIGKAFSNLNGMIGSVADLTGTLREVGTAGDIRKIREIEQKKMSESERQDALMKLLEDMYDKMSDEEKVKYLDLIMKSKRQSDNSASDNTSNKDPEAEPESEAEPSLPYEPNPKAAGTLLGIITLVGLVALFILKPIAQNESTTPQQTSSTSANAPSPAETESESEPEPDTHTGGELESGTAATSTDATTPVIEVAQPYRYEYVTGQGLGTRTFILISEFSTSDSNYKNRLKATISEVVKNDSNIDVTKAWIHVFIDRFCYLQEQAARNCDFSDSNVVASYESYDYTDYNRRLGTHYSNIHKITFFPASSNKEEETWQVR